MSGFRGGLILVLVSLAAGLGLLEVAVRALGLAPRVHSMSVFSDLSSYRLSDNPILGWELRESHHSPDQDHLDYTEILPSTNSDGFRDIEREVKRRPGVRRMILLGDSVVLGTGIRELSDTIPSQLERLFAGGTEVLNIAVGGYCTLPEIELLRVKGLKYRPDLVMLMFVNNDYHNVNGPLMAFPGRAGGYQRYVGRPAFVERLFLWSAAFRALALRFDWYRLRSEVDPVFAGRLNARAIGDDNVRNGLLMLRRLAQEHGFRVVIAVWPNFTDTGIDDAVAHPRAAGGSDRLWLEEQAEQLGFPIYRLSRLWPVERGTNPRKAFTHGDGMHANVKGARLAAEILHSILEKEWPGRPSDHSFEGVSKSLGSPDGATTGGKDRSGGGD